MGLELGIVNVFKTYNGNLILRDCSFAFASGRTYVLQGPNGSGKSTCSALALTGDPMAASYRDNGRVLSNLACSQITWLTLTGISTPRS
jgi:ABC-type multidrug transport system ATPase subunit